MKLPNIYNKYSKSSIKTKMLFIIILFMTIISLVFVGSIRYIINFTEKSIYDNSMSMLKVYIAGIENEMGKIEQLSYGILTDAKIQELLIEIKKADNLFNRFEIQSMLDSYLSIVGLKEDYIKTITLIDGNLTLSQGLSSDVMSNDIKKSILDETILKKGEMLLTLPTLKSDYLFCSRLIRRIDKNLSLDELGVFILGIDVDEFVSVPAKYNKELSANIALADGNHIIYDKGQIFSNYPPDTFKNDSGYIIREVDKTNFFITYSRSNSNGWLYINYIEYEKIFSKLYGLQKIIYMVLIVAFIGLLLISIKFVDGITKPIKDIITRMSIVQNGNLKLNAKDFENNQYSYEITELQSIFVRMIKEINNLIKQNYQKQILIKESQLKALQAQINPHFLYNTLEYINWSAKLEGNKKVSKMVQALAQLFRNSLNTKEAGLISLGKELQLLNYYLDIQNIRFEDRLTISILVEKSMYIATVPSLSIQPIFENAINYVLEAQGFAEITLRAYKENDILIVTVKDNGPGMDPLYLEKESNDKSTNSTGIGLKNINSRIKICFGNAYGLEIKNQQGTIIIMKLPFKECEWNDTV